MQRIMVIGPSGSGKSTLAQIMGQRLALPVVHLDRAYWKANWTPPDRDEWRCTVRRLASGETWVMDGSYASTFDLRLPRVKAVIWLDLPRYLYVSRAAWRSIRTYGQERPDLAPGCREQIDPDFFRNWVWAYPTRGRPRDAAFMQSLPAHVCSIVLRRRADVRQFVAGLPASLYRQESAK
ncbi:MAG: hypothetical protein AB7E81_08315 [Hyphomicrobiaceae bacterium]